MSPRRSLVPPVVALAAVGLALGVLLSACGGALPQPGPKDVAWAAHRWPGTSVEDLRRGRAAYVQRCAACHNLALPAEHPPARWPKLVDNMRGRARLTSQERDAIVRYLMATSARARRPPG